MIVARDLGPVRPEGDVENREPRHLTRPEIAACIMAMLGWQGATFTINEHGYLRANLDALTFPQGDCTPDDMARIVLALSAEIKTIIRAERTAH